MSKCLGAVLVFGVANGLLLNGEILPAAAGYGAAILLGKTAVGNIISGVKNAFEER